MDEMASSVSFPRKAFLLLVLAVCCLLLTAAMIFLVIGAIIVFPSMILVGYFNRVIENNLESIRRKHGHPA